MVPQFMIAAASSIAVLAVSATAFAQQYGTADEAKAMLMKAVAAVKADKAKALDMFNKGEGGFLDRDLYVFCDNLSDAKIVVVGSPNAKQYIGTDVRTEKDAIGKVIGPEILAGMQKPEGQITEVSYMFPRPGADKTPVQKVSLVTRVSDDLGCGVGYYKQTVLNDAALNSECGIAAAMATISISAEAYLAIAASMPEGSQTARRDDRCGYAVILDRMVLDHLKAMPAPGESYSDVILRLAKGESGEE